MHSSLQFGLISLVACAGLLVVLPKLQAQDIPIWENPPQGNISHPAPPKNPVKISSITVEIFQQGKWVPIREKFQMTNNIEKPGFNVQPKLVSTRQVLDRMFNKGEKIKTRITVLYKEKIGKTVWATRKKTLEGKLAGAKLKEVWNIYILSNS